MLRDRPGGLCRNSPLSLIVLLFLFAAPATASEIDQRLFGGSNGSTIRGGVDLELLKLQVLLDRSNISPGEIDGQHNARLGEMITAFAEVSGVSSTPWLAKFWLELALSSAEPALREYTITREDLKGPFLRALPSKMEDMSTLEMVSYTSLPEALAERFHMSELLLKALNPNSSR